ncbi:hypothetical protein ISS42_01315 [Candidatus Shapirobacteria bacterium]|nr:hypothetical protein [Candidatus Shapirobacteria bacterium]
MSEPVDGRLPLEREVSAELGEYQAYIMQGVLLMRQARFNDVVSHFLNAPEAKKKALAVGLTLGRGRGHLLDSLPSDEKIPSLANNAARNSWCRLGKIRISCPAFHPESLHVQSSLPPLLLQEIALICLEEWLHGEQELTDKPLATHDFSVVSGLTEGEIDVAAYMLQMGIPLTATFLHRYDRGEILAHHGLLTEYQKADDSLISTPALRKGVFAWVERSDGTIEPNWQIVRFHPRTGDAILVKVDEQITRQVSLQKLVDLRVNGDYVNERGLYPFAKANSFEDLFSIIDQLGGIYGSWGDKEFFQSADLKRDINQIREWILLGQQKGKRLGIKEIPIVGGLREKVKELLVLAV